jgi:hypothetical protein
MFSTTPNLQDYLAFLSSVVGIPAANFPTAAGVATGGSLLTLIDATQNWQANQWAGSELSDTSQGLNGLISANTANTVNLFQALGASPLAGDVYLIAPPALRSTFNIAMDIVSETLNASPDVYVLAVYNLAADRLINYALDISGQTYFQDLRKDYRIATVSVGVASSANDQGTSVGILNPRAMETFTMLDLQTLKTPYGRAYMGLAQSYGPALWGLT